MNKKMITGISCLALTLATQADAFKLDGTVKTPVAFTNPRLTQAHAKKTVRLMNIQLSAREKQSLFTFTPEILAETDDVSLPKSADLGMNGVPVLDQGSHGDCVTFATTAAIDALLGKGDYVSQLCNLELGSTLANNGYYPSGWDGAFGPMVLDQMMRFGVINKTNQQSKSCAHVKEYPLNAENDEGNPMSLNEFKQMSEDLSEQMDWVSHLSVVTRFALPYADSQANQALLQVKQALLRNHRATIGVFLIVNTPCNVGACATYHAAQDTWALTQELKIPSPEVGGHELVVMGYDDDAVATDKTGKKHRGLLKLRNSWSADVGDQGNFYMTYDYFKKFLIEAQEIVNVE